ncbi:MAG TPA: integrase arm-type DNA-binding domain-containing protein [Steroidobacteraceae bacterium]|nr:integrase arm-type DNA-binding domain-containing protein [Steroidobacteraceae bacterium]
MSLTDAIIKSTTATDKPVSLWDTDGLYLLVNPSGSKLWRFKYQFERKEKRISLGSYPEVSLAKARLARNEARAKVAAGVNPSAERQEQAESSRHTFEAIARELLGEKAKTMQAVTITDATWRLEQFLLPALGTRNVEDITSQEVLAVLRKMEERPGRKLGDTIQRCKMLACQVFRRAKLVHGLKVQVSGDDFRGAVTVKKAKHHAGITDPKKLGELLRAIDSFPGQPSNLFAMRILPYVFLRSTELRGAEWSEIDFDAATWRVPNSRMKMKDPDGVAHQVPLAPSVVTLLRELHKYTGHTKFLFPSLVPGKVISENTIGQGLKRLGYDSDVQTTHGFRTTFSRLGEEIGLEDRLIELQLDHAEQNEVKGAYKAGQRGRLLEQRREMMNRWAEYLDGLRASK